MHFKESAFLVVRLLQNVQYCPSYSGKDEYSIVQNDLKQICLNTRRIVEDNVFLFIHRSGSVSIYA